MSIAEKLQTIAENEQKVYDAGIQAERKKMWDSLQNYGKRTSYASAFRESYFGGRNFYPQYDMKPKSISGIFYNSNDHTKAGVLRLANRLKECGVTLDTSECTNFLDAFSSASIVIGDLGTFDIRKNTNVTRMIFYAGSTPWELSRVKFIVDENTNLTDLCSGAGAFGYISFEGTIGKSLNISSASKLKAEYAKTIITTNLKNIKGTDLEGTLSFKLHSDVWANLNTSGTAPDGSTWEEYVQYTLGWGI